MEAVAETAKESVKKTDSEEEKNRSVPALARPTLDQRLKPEVVEQLHAAIDAGRFAVALFTCPEPLRVDCVYHPTEFPDTDLSSRVFADLMAKRIKK